MNIGMKGGENQIKMSGSDLCIPSLVISNFSQFPHSYVTVSDLYNRSAAK